MEQDYLTPNKTFGCASSTDGLKDIETIFRTPDEVGSVEILENYIYEIIERKIKNKKELEGVLRELNKKYHIMGSCMKLLYVYRSMCKRKLIKYDIMYEELFQSKGFRSQSGVLVVAVFTSPYPETMKDGVMTKQAFSCEYDCYYCPAEPNQPRSYLLNEPGVRRANHNKFDAVNQFRDRIGTYIAMGHPIDKIELIVLGGTWSSYPKDYQDSFIRDVMYAANTLYETRDRLPLVE
jgi:histone acetyltransferase (RNA polymerase elongator complex component)